jgi:hypothetical protein
MASKTPVNEKVRRARGTLNKTPPLPDIVKKNQRREPRTSTDTKQQAGDNKASVADSVRTKRHEAGAVETSYALPNVPDESPEEILKRLRAGEKNFLDDLIGTALDFSDEEDAKNGEYKRATQ